MSDVNVINTRQCSAGTSAGVVFLRSFILFFSRPCPSWNSFAPVTKSINVHVLHCRTFAPLLIIRRFFPAECVAIKKKRHFKNCQPPVVRSFSTDSTREASRLELRVILIVSRKTGPPHSPDTSSTLNSFSVSFRRARGSLFRSYRFLDFLRHFSRFFRF